MATYGFSTGAWGGLGNYRSVAGDVTVNTSQSANAVTASVLAEFKTQSNVGYANSFARPGYYDRSTSADYWAVQNSFSINHPGSDWATAGSAQETYSFARKATAYNVEFKGWFRMGSSTWEQMCFLDITIPALWVPWAPTNVVNTRNSDTQNTLSWNNGSGGEGAPNKVVERSIDGGGWTQVAVVANTATSWIDTSCAQDHTYQYRIRSEWYGQGSAWVTSNTTSNTPQAPGKPTMSRTSATAVSATFANTSKTANALEWQRSSDNVNWGTITSISGKVTTFSDIPGGGTFYYRARNKSGSLVSGWSPASDPVVTIIAPAAPSLTSPQSGGLFTTADSLLTFMWQHNPLDGSAQSAAQFRCSNDNGATWFTVDIAGSVQSCSKANDFPVNSTVLWQVRTKGAHADFSPWSSLSTFSVKAVPQVSIITPANESALATMPLVIIWEYSDESGTQTGAEISIINSNGQVLYREALDGAATTVEVTSAEFLPENHNTYYVALSVTSTSTITATANTSFETDYIPPATPILETIVDGDKFAVDLIAQAGEDEGAPETTSMGIFRRKADGSLLSIADRIDPNAAVTDNYPPLGVDVTYICAAYTETGLAAVSEHTVFIDPHGYFAFNFNGELLKIRLNVNTSNAVVNDTELVHYYGRQRPVIYGGEQRSETLELSGSTRDDETRRLIDRLKNWGFKTVFRDIWGYSVNVHCLINTTRNVEDAAKTDVTISMTAGD